MSDPAARLNTLYVELAWKMKFPTPNPQNLLKDNKDVFHIFFMSYKNYFAFGNSQGEQKFLDGELRSLTVSRFLQSVFAGIQVIFAGYLVNTSNARIYQSLLFLISFNSFWETKTMIGKHKTLTKLNKIPIQYWMLFSGKQVSSFEIRLHVSLITQV